MIHVDDTSSNINGARWWLHDASTEKLTAYHLPVLMSDPVTYTGALTMGRQPGANGHRGRS